MSRFLGLDLGTRRIGVALSDPTGTVATPLLVLAHTDRRRDLAAVARLAAAHGVARIVVGWPRNMDGTRGPAARRAEAFADALRRLVDVPIDLWDERLSTVAADRTLREVGVRRDRRRVVRDQIAAALILQAYLTARAPAGESNDPPGSPRQRAGGRAWR
ncbi:MAG TPA: Holliday junction resolvase RuvX [bacterium]|nr:Holliday junction resolvase RuvX [bacterium]